ncbi:MAG: tetratricopeptide repeat protein [Holophagaceae bacterium]
MAGLGVGYFLAGRAAPAPQTTVLAPGPGPAGLPAGFPGSPGAPAAAAPGLPPPAAAPGPGGPPALPSPQLLARIDQLEKAVAANPKDLRAWIELGNHYFDTHQASKSIEAYGKALALNPKNPDVLTDQGVMYRQAGEFKKALANFEKAAELDPRHAQSRFNIGIVYAQDLKQPEKAVAAWRKLIETNPQSPQAENARRAIEGLQGGHTH